MGVEGTSGWKELVTLDINFNASPDVIWDLNDPSLPFPDNTFDEIHAYEVLEHLGSQGDEKFFFDQFYDFWRILKPGGFFFATVPSPTSIWAFGDPGHRRVLPAACLVFLSQSQYLIQLGKTPMSDYRALWKGDFVVVQDNDDGQTTGFILQAIK